MFLVELAGIILSYVNKGKLDEVVVDSMKLYGDGTPEGNVVTDAWDTLQNTVSQFQTYVFYKYAVS